jgi:hypothetical protein
LKCFGYAIYAFSVNKLDNAAAYSSPLATHDETPWEAEEDVHKATTLAAAKVDYEDLAEGLNDENDKEIKRLELIRK